ncbi:hypothetical protein V565_138910 [Rhizoctonia solani 123E]|uniref:F-box-like domain protein n=1 Tax=Rhizoctonia solani 123E TaxID=1423351 RepID=A0A074RTE4_9AGAM|nr:hypothetical protein V565_138910 [Rhizoctonia solani 123E]
MDIPRTIRCLRTLSAKPEVARLVRSFSLNHTISRVFRSFHSLLSRALSNMTGLHTLSIMADFTISRALIQMSCQLIELVCYVPPEDSRYIPEFLSTQPTIKKLTILCPSGDLSTLHPDALPSLRELSAPTHLLDTLLLARLPCLSRLCVLGASTNTEKFFFLVLVFRIAKHFKSLELVIEMDLTTHMGTSEAVAVGLALIGLAAPYIISLKLDIHKGHILPHRLQNMFAFCLPWFPNLKTLTVTSPPPTPNEHTRGSSQSRPWKSHATTFYSLHRILLAMSDTPVDFSALFRAPYPKIEYTEDFEPQNPPPNALYDTSCHVEILRAWRRVHSGLEAVFFPEYGYEYMDKKCSG